MRLRAPRACCPVTSAPDPSQLRRPPSLWPSFKSSERLPLNDTIASAPALLNRLVLQRRNRSCVRALLHGVGMQQVSAQYEPRGPSLIGLPTLAGRRRGSSGAARRALNTRRVPAVLNTGAALLPLREMAKLKGAAL